MIFDLFYTILFFLISLGFANQVLERKDIMYRKALRWLIVFHFVMGIIFYFFTRNGGGDAWTYWMNAKEMTDEQFQYNITHELGTYFIEAINYIPVHYLGVSFFANTMFFAMLGSFGVSCFYTVILKLIPFNTIIYGYKAFPTLLFLPNMHFWSSGVGKDTLMYMCVGMFVYAMIHPFKRILWIVIAALLAYAIRPHVVLFMAFSFGIVYLFGKELSTSRKIFFTILFATISVMILPAVMSFVKIDNLTVETISARADNQSELLKVGSGSGVDISSYPIPLKMFTFIFRPLFFDAHNVTSLLASFENFILLIITIKALRFKPIATYKAAPNIIKAVLIFLLIGSLLFSITLGNLGLMIRMRNMFLPGLVMYLLWAISFKAYFQHSVIQETKKE